ncbi:MULTISPECIES: plasmid partitioning/stability family protein [Pectobacterium]|uniref:plasmid partitioning/stability family protein n=1 Tax=Pectobacterium TaxID=122277 RepID=UPI001FCB549E|nr:MULTISPECIES: plasmid partitioning/stability family protein [Pectobacterium]
MADSNEERKKISLYLHPDELPDLMALAEIKTVPQKNRGALYREALITGLVLRHLDARLPAVLTALFTEKVSADQVVEQISQITGWKPSKADIRDILSELGYAHTNSSSVVIDKDDEETALAEARKKVNSLM